MDTHNPVPADNPHGSAEDSAESTRPARRPPIFSIDAYQSIVEEQIRDAFDRGEFDDLPGAGKPLVIDKNEYAGDKELAYKLLKDNNFTLPWIADRNDAIDEVNRFRERLARQWIQHGLPLQALARAGRRDDAQYRWRAVLELLEAEVQALNRQIDQVNLGLPVRNLALLPLRLGEELARVGGGLEL